MSLCILHFLFFPEPTPTTGYPVSPARALVREAVKVCATGVSHSAALPVLSWVPTFFLSCEETADLKYHNLKFPLKSNSVGAETEAKAHPGDRAPRGPIACVA